MEKAQESLLSFTGFLITHSKIDIKGPVGNKMDISLDASGEIRKEENIFHLALKVNVVDDLEKLFIEVKAETDFKIGSADLNDSTISNYLYLNAPAIIFPYVRAYITSLTSLSGLPPVIIPPINITGLKEKLKEQTVLK